MWLCSLCRMFILNVSESMSKSILIPVSTCKNHKMWLKNFSKRPISNLNVCFRPYFNSFLTKISFLIEITIRVHLGSLMILMMKCKLYNGRINQKKHQICNKKIFKFQNGNYSNFYNWPLNHVPN